MQTLFVFAVWQGTFITLHRYDTGFNVVAVWCSMTRQTVCREGLRRGATTMSKSNISVSF